MPNPTHPSTRPAGSVTATPTPTRGSQTLLQTSANGPSIPITTTLRLRAEPSRRRIQWAEDVVDNEGMGKKSSKVCCIYHKPHEPGDGSGSESDSSSSSSDSEPDLSRARRAGGSEKGRGRGEGHDHDQGDGSADGKGKGRERKASPNAYERQPKYKSQQER